MEETNTSHPTRKKPRITTETGSSSNPSSYIYIPSLPDELSLEILSRLSPKTLSQLKTISKPWHQLISSPDFAKIHFSKSVNNPNLTHHRLILSTARPHFSLSRISVPLLMQNDSGSSVVANEIDYPMKHPHNSVWLVGSLNGLVCIVVNEDHVFLWNPTLGKSKKLPRFQVKSEPGWHILYGFGYDEANDNYKVVGIFCVFRSVNVCETEIKIYSRNANSWKSIESFKEGIPLNDSGKFVGGKLHWLTRPGFGLYCRWSIVSLDVHDETFGEVEQPEYGDGDYDLILGILGGWLCVLCNIGKTRADVWVMKEYGKQETWTKLVTFPYSDDPEKPIHEAPMWLFGSGEILLVFGSMFLLYNPKDNSRRHLQINDLDTTLEAIIYVESLVSPGLDAAAPRGDRWQIESK